MRGEWRVRRETRTGMSAFLTRERKRHLPSGFTLTWLRYSTAEAFSSLHSGDKSVRQQTGLV